MNFIADYILDKFYSNERRNEIQMVSTPLLNVNKESNDEVEEGKKETTNTTFTGGWSAKKRTFQSVGSMNTNVNADKTRVVIWCRISTENQQTGTSLQMQESECRKYCAQSGLPDPSVVYKLVGSGYTISPEIKNALQYIDGLLGQNKKVIIVAHMPDRFMRRQNLALEYIDKLNENGGGIHFVKDIEGKSLTSETKAGFDKIKELLKLAAAESKIKSVRLKEAYRHKQEGKFIDSITNLACIRIREFVNLFMEGGLQEDIFNAFRRCVNWDAHPEWSNARECRPRQNTYYQVPFYVDESMLTGVNRRIKKCETDEEYDTRLKSVLELLKDYEIDVPTIFAPRKKWTIQFLRDFMVDQVEELNEQFTEM